jgi:cullin 3
MMGLTGADVIKDDKGEPTWTGVHNLHYYKEYFEEEYIRQTREYYESEAKKWITTMSCPEYVNIATSSLKKEEEKVVNFLDKETRPKLITQLDDKIVDAYARTLADMDKTGVREMLSNKRKEELKALCTLLARKPNTLNCILEKLDPYIVSRGDALIAVKENVEDPVVYMTKLIELKREMDELVRESFGNREQFIKSNDHAFQTILDKFELSARFLAYYIDFLMRQGLRGKEAETESIIEDAFGLFKLLKPKDAFTEHNKVCRNTKGRNSMPSAFCNGARFPTPLKSSSSPK